LRCTVRFRPKVKKAALLLPLPVRRLALLLDQTMGRGENEGSLQPTARLRLNVEDTWANAALRPWVLGEPYNNTEAVNAGLKDWSSKGASYLKVYRNIQRQYPLAQRSLAEFYEKNFHRSAAEAESLSSYVLDIAFRSHYAFHSDDSISESSRAKSQSNPW
jgi:hypothetical protein